MPENRGPRHQLLRQPPAHLQPPRADLRRKRRHGHRTRRFRRDRTPRRGHRRRGRLHLRPPGTRPARPMRRHRRYHDRGGLPHALLRVRRRRGVQRGPPRGLPPRPRRGGTLPPRRPVRPHPDGHGDAHGARGGVHGDRHGRRRGHGGRADPREKGAGDGGIRVCVAAAAGDCGGQRGVRFGRVGDGAAGGACQWTGDERAGYVPGESGVYGGAGGAGVVSVQADGAVECE
mmetsp:Transcript_13265/g.26505  ORF Transcript_13265/g.26505 Transcript_13265/m.26505 type:complete len:231 (+) Transcript_13265:987-1679(+)